MEKSNKKAVKRFPLAQLCRIAIMAALLCVASPWSIPVGPIPISLATFVVYLIGIVLGWLDGTIAVAVYLLLGAIGLPVFSGGAGGFQKLIGATGGYLIGYLPCVVRTSGSGRLSEWFSERLFFTRSEQHGLWFRAGENFSNRSRCVSFRFWREMRQRLRCAR